MTTADAPKMPRTPWDEQIALHQMAKWNAESSFGKMLTRWEDRQEGYRRALADLAPLHRQVVEALEALTEAVEDYISAGAEDLRGWRDDLLKEAHAALDAARKVGW